MLTCRGPMQELPWSALCSGERVPEEERGSQGVAAAVATTTGGGRSSPTPPNNPSSEVPATWDERDEMEVKEEYGRASGEAEGMEE